MREELKHNTSIGSLSGIQLFISLLLDKKVTTRAAFSSLCSYVPSSVLNYTSALYLFDDLQIIEYNGKSLILTEHGISLINKDDCARLFEIGKMALQHVISEKMLNSEEIKYSLESNSIEIPINAFSLYAAVYRNFLIAINAFSLKDGKLNVSSVYEECFETACNKTKRIVSQEELIKKLEQQQIEGEKGELFAVEYENKRFCLSGKKARRISQIDVAAGYDILSYKDDSSQEYDRYIEVKTYHGNPHFYWSENERNTSMLLKDKYCLFLVDIDKMSESEYKPIIICDPYNNLSDDIWITKPQTFYVCKI